MKKKLLMLVALFAMVHLGLSAESIENLVTWSYGSYPGIAVGQGNSMPSFGTIIGNPLPDVKIEIPGSAQEQEYSMITQKENQSSIVETRDILLLYLSEKKVHIQGPIVEGVAPKTDVYKYISACYSTNEWPTPFANGRQECKAFKFGLMSYEVVKDPGLYRVTFPAGAIYFNGEPCEEFTVNFNVQDNTVYTPTAFDFEVSPLTNYPLERLVYPQISINNFDDDSRDIYQSKGVSPTGDVTLTNVATNEVRVCPFSNVGGTVSRLVWEANINDDGPITTPGTYILRIPEGKIRLFEIATGKNVTNQALEYTFIVEQKKNYYNGAPQITPAAGNVTAIQCLEINQPSGYAIALPSTILPFTFTLPDGTEKKVTPRDGWRGHTIYLDMDAPFTTKGEYTLSIPEGGILYYKATSDGDIADESSPYLTKAQTVKYNVTWGEEADLDITTDPVNNSTIFKVLENVFFTFAEPVTPTYGLLATVKWPDGTTVHYPLDGAGNEDKTQLPYQYKVTYSQQNNRFMIGLHYPQMKGKYEITIPAGVAKTADGKINKAYTINVDWSEREVMDLDITSDPANGEKLSYIPQEIFLTIPSNVVKAQPADGGITTALFFTPGAEVGVNRYIVDAGSRFYVNLRQSYPWAPEIEGLYTVQIPEASFICTLEDGREVFNAKKTFSWILDQNGGVYEVAVEDGHVTVYDLNGRLILRNVEAEQLRTLKGVYIVNGIKTILR